MTTNHNPTPSWAKVLGGDKRKTAGQRLVEFNRMVWRRRIHPKRKFSTK